MEKLFAALPNVICSFIAVVVCRFGLPTYPNQNLEETSLHGKGPVDGVGGEVKRSVWWAILPKPRMNNSSQAKTWMKPMYSTEEKNKWRLPWPTSPLLPLRLTKYPVKDLFRAFFIKPLKQYAVDKGQKTWDRLKPLNNYLPSSDLRDASAWLSYGQFAMSDLVHV